jgi:hypothetical protein
MSATHLLLSLDRLRAQLGHKDRWIRTAAAKHLIRVLPQDATLLQAVLDATDRFGARANDELLRLAQELPVDQAAFDRLVAALPKAEGRWGQGLRLLVCRAPAALLLPVLDRVLELDVWTARERDRLENRREIEDCSVDEAWGELADLAEAEQDEDLSGREQDLLDDLVLSLARRPELTTDELRDVIRNPGQSAPLQLAAAARILSLRGERAAAQEILALLTEENPGVALEAAYAMSRVSDAAAVDAIMALASDGTEFAMTQATALEGWHDPRAAAALAKLAQTEEEDPDMRVELLLAACSSFDEANVKMALDAARQIDADETSIFLAGELLPYLDVLGIAAAERGRWSKIRKDEEEAFMRDEERLWLVAGDEDVEDDEGEDEDSAEEADRDDEEAEAEPARKGPLVLGPKVGRNDACPCGSGKKYKKCCLAQESETP